VSVAACRRGEREQRGAVVDGGPCELLLDARQQAAQIGESARTGRRGGGGRGGAADDRRAHAHDGDRFPFAGRGERCGADLRDAPTMTTSEAGGREATNRRAASRRTAADADTRARTTGNLQMGIYRSRQPFTGPPWKNCSGVMTPSRLNTSPSFMTNCTDLSA